MSRVEFFVPCVPPKTSHHAKRIVRAGRFARLADKPELNAAKDSLDAWFLQHQPAQPVPGPLAVRIDLTWPWRKGDTKRDRAKGAIPHAAKPDWDNAAKGICDCLARLRFLEHDGAIVDGRVQKWRGDHPGIRINLYTVSDI